MASGPCERTGGYEGMAGLILFSGGNSMSFWCCAFVFCWLCVVFVAEVLSLSESDVSGCSLSL